LRSLVQKLKETELILSRNEARNQVLVSTDALRREEIANLSAQVRELQSALSKSSGESSSLTHLRESMAYENSQKDKEIINLNNQIQLLTEKNRDNLELRTEMQRMKFEIDTLHKEKNELASEITSKAEVIKQMSQREVHNRKEAAHVASLEAEEIVKLSKQVSKEEVEKSFLITSSFFVF
jgi:hypothetical protein